MGTVKDVYMQYLSLGDHFVGRCLAMLPLLQMEFVSPPPHFVPAWNDWGESTVLSSSLCLMIHHSFCVLN